MPELWKAPVSCQNLRKWGVQSRHREGKKPDCCLRFRDLRHQAITELAESQASDQTIMAIAGHVSQEMLQHYSHVRLDAKRKALDALAGGGSGGGYDTNSGTNPPTDSARASQVAENVGGRDRDRTGDLIVANDALSQLSYRPLQEWVDCKL